MAGVIRGEAAPKEKLVRFGYINLTGVVDGTFLKRGERIRGHEFHYWDSTNNGTDAKALKPDGKRSWLRDFRIFPIRPIRYLQKGSCGKQSDGSSHKKKEVKENDTGRVEKRDQTFG